MLASIGTLPGEAGWSYEVKWDGVRALAYVRDGSVRLESRNLKDFTPRYPELVGEGAIPDSLTGRQVLLDGEVVGFDERGRVSFGALQHRMHLTSAGDVRGRMATHPVAFMVFDVLWVDGDNLIKEPYEARRARLDSLELVGGLWQVPPAVWDSPEDGEDLLEASRLQGLEGIVAKKLGSVYEPGKRSRAWRKVKNQARQELVIGGWLPGAGNRSNTLGAILVGYCSRGQRPGVGVGPHAPEEGRSASGRGEEPGQRHALHYAGRVGTGFSWAVLRDLLSKLEPLERDDSPFVDNPRLPTARWVEPRLVAEVGFAEWTGGGTLRHPVYLGLREDKDPAQVVREPVMGEN